MTEIDLTNMKPVRHRWADVIIAWAEGKEIQARYTLAKKSNWEDWKDQDTPAFNAPSVEWRVKPVLTGWINIYKDKHQYTRYCVKDSKEEADKTADASRIACIQITYTKGEGL